MLKYSVVRNPKIHSLRSPAPPLSARPCGARKSGSPPPYPTHNSLRLLPPFPSFPPFPPPHSCHFNLAWRDCKQCEFAYCFECFRMSHNYVGADRHTWKMVEPLMCSLCTKNTAAKEAKGKNFCMGCFTRLEKSGVFRGKVAQKTLKDV